MPKLIYVSTRSKKSWRDTSNTMCTKWWILPILMTKLSKEVSNKKKIFLNSEESGKKIFLRFVRNLASRVLMLSRESPNSCQKSSSTSKRSSKMDLRMNRMAPFILTCRNLKNQEKSTRVWKKPKKMSYNKKIPTKRIISLKMKKNRKMILFYGKKRRLMSPNGLRLGVLDDPAGILSVQWCVLVNYQPQ